MRYDEQTLRPAIEAAFDQGGLDAVCRLVVTLLNEQEARHQAVIAKLEARVAELEKRLNKNSSNSSKPPSSDGLKRTQSLRSTTTGRKPGGQPGHPGRTLLQSASPDITVAMPLNECPECGADLSKQPVVGEEKRQVFDLPAIRIRVTEYQAQRKVCPNCGRVVTAGLDTRQARTPVFPHSRDGYAPSRKDRFDDGALDVGEAVVAALKAIGQAGVVDA